MTNMKTTKRALLSSMFALFLCFCMLLGTTYAWFTDSVTSKNNIIQSGTLDVEMYYAEGNLSLDTDTWKDASTGAIFNYDKWEPGYVDAKHIMIENAGTLALNYQLRIVANGAVSMLADVIDVYYFDGGKQLTRNDVTSKTKLGTLADIMGGNKNISNTVKGTLAPKGQETVEFPSVKILTLALKMQEDAGNEYQDLSIGTDFAIELMATQANFEEDSFGLGYDDPSLVPQPQIPSALVRPLKELDVSYTIGIGGAAESGTLDVGYQFEPTSSDTDVLASEYRYWHADFVVYADNTVPANSMALAGYYEAWCQFNNYNWVAMTSDEDISAGTQIRLVEVLGATVNWEEICTYGNDGIGFRCGAVDLTGENAGTTLTVELRLYETTKAWDDTSGTANDETGKYLTVASFKYTFPATTNTVNTVDELQAAIDNALVGETNVINFAKDITGDVEVIQKEGVDLVINGCGNKYNGVMTVFGNGRQSGAEALTIKNINFVAKNDADSCILSPDRVVNDKYSYAHNLTVENCTFTDPDGDVNCAAVRCEDGGDKNFAVINCTVDNTMHSLLQVNNIAEKLTVTGCTVNSKNGVNLNCCTNVLIDGCNFDVKGYAVRFGVKTGGNPDESKTFLIKDSTLKSACHDGDAIIIFRESARTNTNYNIENSVLDGTLEYIGW